MNRDHSRHSIAALVLASTALVAACSYDWDIGSGPPSEIVGGPSTTDAGSQPDAAPITPVPDGGAPETGAPATKGGECGPNCKCEDGETCEFTCPKGTNCKLTCKDNSTCKLACADGTTCALTCDDDAKCNMGCASGSACTFAADRSATCGGTCGQGAFCRYERNDCDVTCEPSSVCLR